MYECHFEWPYDNLIVINFIIIVIIIIIIIIIIVFINIIMLKPLTLPEFRVGNKETNKFVGKVAAGLGRAGLRWTA